MRVLNFILTTACIAILSACYKAEPACENKYDLCYSGTRDYNLTFDHIEVEEESGDINGLLQPDDLAYLKVYLKNNGPDPCMLTEGTFKEVVDVNGFYISNSVIGINDGGFKFEKPSEEEGYDVHYIDPGSVDYLKVKVRAYSHITPDQDVALVFNLMDDDGSTHTVNFSIHIYN
ncbi:MAG: hypothetical protein WDZ35_16055 [Crocinitomicaceae bacterium]